MSLLPDAGTVWTVTGQVLMNKTTWAEALDEESAFWRKWFDTQGMGWKDYVWRRDTTYPFQEDLKPYCPKEGVVRVLDVGAGPLTVLGKVWKGRHLELVAVDPLAEKYDQMLSEAGVVPIVRTIKGEGEHLLDLFPRDSFDLVYACNCLDHSYEPLSCFHQMLAVTKPGGYIVTDHLVNEGQAEHYAGLHQWNFGVYGIWRRRFVIWRPGTKHDLQDELGNAGLVKAKSTRHGVERGSKGHVYTWIQKKQNKP